MASKVKGLDRLTRQLAALPNSVRVAIADELEMSAEDLADAIRRAAPADSGDLRTSIGSCEGEPPKTSATGAFGASSKGLSRWGSALNRAGLLFSVFAGNNKVFYPRWVEFGTSGSVRTQRMGARSTDYKQHKTHGRKARRTHPGTRAQPFFFPTIRAWRKVLRTRMVKAARKAAKEIAALR